MKQVSSDYEIKMASSCRNRSHVKITLVSGGVTYEFKDEDISSTSRTDDIDPISRRAPKETFTFSIFDYLGEYNPSNPIGKWSSLDENAEISVTYGFELSNSSIEWLSSDYYILSGKPTFSNGIVTFKANSKLTSLTKSYYKGVVDSSNLYDLAEAVLLDAGIDSNHYEIDNSLENIVTTAPIPVTSHLNALQLIAHAGLCYIRTVSGVIHIEKLNLSKDTSDFYIGLDSIELNGDAISKIETLYEVEASLFSYVAEETSSELGRFVIDASEETKCHVEYPLSKNQTIAISGSATLTDTHLYGSAADFTIEGTGTFEVVVTGYKVKSSSSKVISVISNNANGSTDSEKNELITSYATLYALIYHVSNYLRYRLTHTVKYRGNPELESSDIVYFATKYDNKNIRALVLSTTLNYDGALSGSLILKSLNEIDECNLYDSVPTLVEDSNDEAISIISDTNYQSDYLSSEMDEFISEVNEDE